MGCCLSHYVMERFAFRLASRTRPNRGLFFFAKREKLTVCEWPSEDREQTEKQGDMNHIQSGHVP